MKNSITNEEGLFIVAMFLVATRFYSLRVHWQIRPN